VPLEFGHGLDVPYVQTSPAVVDRMLAMGHVGKNDVVIDLGCGDGRIVIEAVRKHGARGIGYDIDPERVDEARKNARRAGVSDRATFEVQDLFTAPIGEADLVTVYLLPPVMDRLAPRLRRELRPGTRIVSHSFSIHGWKPDEEVHAFGRTLYRWTVPRPVPAGGDTGVAR
jgi:ribosomal protein L11 methylase PrmA